MSKLCPNYVHNVYQWVLCADPKFGHILSIQFMTKLCTIYATYCGPYIAHISQCQTLGRVCPQYDPKFAKVKVWAKFGNLDGAQTLAIFSHPIYDQTMSNIWYIYRIISWQYQTLGIIWHTTKLCTIYGVRSKRGCSCSGLCRIYGQNMGHFMGQRLGNMLTAVHHMYTFCPTFGQCI